VEALMRLVVQLGFVGIVIQAYMVLPFALGVARQLFRPRS